MQMAEQLKQTQMDILGMAPTSGVDQQMLVKFREVDPFNMWVRPHSRVSFEVETGRQVSMTTVLLISL